MRETTAEVETNWAVEGRRISRIWGTCPEGSKSAKLKAEDPAQNA